MKLFTLRTGPERGTDKSKIDLFFKDYFLVAMPTGLVQIAENGGKLKGPTR